MSLYNLVHGENPFSRILLAILGLDRDQIPRYRDCWFTGSEIAVHTRTGGGNREYYEDKESCRANYPECFNGEKNPPGPWNSDLRKIESFLRDEDDDYDPTYATFYYSVPETILKELQALNISSTPASERWQTFFDRMEKADTTDPNIARITKSLEPIIKAIQDLGKQQS